jgi:hypothetical protein
VAKLRLHAYRYRAAPGTPRATRNRSFGYTIGVTVVIGRHAYCLNWADPIPGAKTGTISL